MNEHVTFQSQRVGRQGVDVGGGRNQRIASIMIGVVEDDVPDTWGGVRPWKGDGLHITFESGDKLSIYDDGQECCESRFMRSDSDFEYFIGAQLYTAELVHIGTIEDTSHLDDETAKEVAAGEVADEVTFIQITTSKGLLSAHCHNVHNGYYGGFTVVSVFSTSLCPTCDVRTTTN